MTSFGCIVRTRLAPSPLPTETNSSSSSNSNSSSSAVAERKAQVWQCICNGSKQWASPIKHQHLRCPRIKGVSVLWEGHSIHLRPRKFHQDIYLRHPSGTYANLSARWLAGSWYCQASCLSTHILQAITIYVLVMFLLGITSTRSLLCRLHSRVVAGHSTLQPYVMLR